MVGQGKQTWTKGKKVYHVVTRGGGGEKGGGEGERDAMLEKVQDRENRTEIRSQGKMAQEGCPIGFRTRKM